MDSTTSLDRADTSFTGVVDLVKTYAKQETVEPIKASGRFIAYGSASAVLVAVGFLLLLLGLLRVLEYEFGGRLSRGTLSWVPYAVVLVLAVAAVAIAISRIS